KRKLPHPLTPRTLALQIRHPPHALPLPHPSPRLPHRRRHPADPIPPDSDPAPPPAPGRHHPLLLASWRTSAALPPPVPEASVGALRRRAAALVPPSPPHLHRHLRWLLASASAPSPSSAPLGNEHWKDLVVAVRDDVLIPRPETEAVVDMVATTDCKRGSWSSPSSSSAAASRLGAIAMPCVDVLISFHGSPSSRG
uniref:Uncharacterized protein n=1 Tax=Triticum urartu TaxID=4572 RepID=A0A8R7QCZ6_TRIUA